MKEGQATTAKKVKEIMVKNLGKSAGGWYVFETEHFRLHSAEDDTGTAEKVCRKLEAVRADVLKKWTAVTDKAQENIPMCDVYLYVDPKHYFRETGVQEHFPGCSKVERDFGGRVISRRIDLQRGNLEQTFDTPLPHEATHVSLVEVYGDHHPARWFDEGIAMLSQKADDKIRQKLEALDEEQKLLTMLELLTLGEYPADRKRLDAFYLQSISFVQFLTQRKDTQTVTKFARDGKRKGDWRAAAEKHYGFKTIEELQRAWRAHVFIAERIAAPKSR